MGFLGLGVGKLRLTLDRQDVEAGALLTGGITLDLKEPVEARKLVVRLVATQRRREKRRQSDGSERMVNTTVTVFETERELGGEGTYDRGTFPFEIRVPASPDLPDQVAGVARLARALVDVVRGPLEWRIHAALVQPWKFDVKASADISVHG